jgi:hypothetical protein
MQGTDLMFVVAVVGMLTAGMSITGRKDSV